MYGDDVKCVIPLCVSYFLLISLPLRACFQKVRCAGGVHLICNGWWGWGGPAKPRISVDLQKAEGVQMD